jgi:gliding motility-associated-like protein
MKQLFIFLLSITFVNLVEAQCTAPSFTVNLTASTDTTAIISHQTRAGVCCGSSNCVTFLVYANPSSELISFDVTSPSPSGSAYYQVNCGTPVSIGTPLCIVGLASPFTITYCKPGGDSPDYQIGAGTVVHASRDISVQKVGCVDTLFVSNVNISSIVWTSVYPGAQGAYNSYLSCTSGCNSTLVTPGASPPPYVDFMVSGMPNTSCGSFSRDTVRVYFVNKLTGTITPATPVICSASGTTVTLTANVSGGALPYKYDWSSDPGPNNSYTTTIGSAGTYNVIIRDNTKCPAVTLSKIIGTIPVTTFSYPASNYCKNVTNPAPVFAGSGQAGLFSASPAGLSFVSTSTGEINLAASSSGTYVVTNTISPSGTCPGSSATTSIIIYPYPTMTSASTASICINGVVNIPFSSSMSSTYTWLTTDNVNTSGESITTQTTTSLTNTITGTNSSLQILIYTVTPTAIVSGNCVGNPQTVSVTINPKDNPAFTYPSSTNCQTGANPPATITGLAGGTFSANSGGLVFLNAAGTINLPSSTISSYTVTYATNGICPNSQIFPITITTAPSAAFSYSGTPYCQIPSKTNPLPTFGAGAGGGSFSVTPAGLIINNLTGELDLLSSTAGTYTVTNTIAASGGCGVSTATTAITVTALQSAAFNYTASPICQNGTNPLPTFIGSGGTGTFTSTAGLNVSAGTGSINLSLSSAGIYTVTNTIAAAGGCPLVSETSTITITPLPIATFNYTNTPYCQNGTNPLPTFTGGGMAGVFSSSSVFLDINSATGLINLANSTADNYIVVNTIAASNGCPAVVASGSVTITKLPITTILYSGTPYCSNSANPTPTLNVDGTNGIYTYTPSGLSIDANAGTINLASSTVGTYTITNTVAASNGCPTVVSSYPITISQLPSAIFNYSATPYCINGSNPSPSYTGTATAGTFSATAGLSVNVSSGSVNIGASSAGTFTVTNTISAANGCPDVSEINTITINPIATASAGTDAVICASNSYSLAGSIGGAATTLSWTTNGNGTFNNATTGLSVYTPSASDISAGNVILTITSNDPAGPCSSAIDAMTLSINPTPTVSAGSTNTLTCSNTTLSLSGSGTGTYSWNGPGIISGSNTATPTINLPGTYSLVVTSALSCPSSISTVSISQNTTTPSPTASNSTTLTCLTTTASLIGGPASGVTYQWSGPAITGISTTQNIVASASGTYTLLVKSTVNGCTNTAVTSVTQNTVAPITTGSTTGSITCTTNTINLNSTLAGMNYTWTAPSGSSILSGSSLQNAVGQGLGTYSVYVLNPTNNCTYSTTTAAIQNTTTPSGVSAGSNQSLICGVSSVTLTGTATPTNSSVNWLGGVCGSSTNFITTACAPGAYTLSVAHPITGCVSISTVAVVSSTDTPQATVNAVTNSITCTNSLVIIGVTLNNSDPVNYSWSGSGISGASNTAVITTTASGTYSVTITNTVTSCQAIYTAIVPTNTTPVIVTISSASSITCSSPTETLNVSPVGAQYNYSWNGTSITSGGTTTNPVVDLGGDFDVTITNTISGCVGTATVTVPSDTVLPVVFISAPSVTTTCADPTATLNISPTPSTDITYAWAAPSTGALDSYAVSNPVASGNGIFTVVVTNTISGCASSATQNTIEVIPDAAIPSTTLSISSVSITCSVPTPSVSLTTNIGTTSYNWSPSSGIVSGTENTSTPSFSAAGTYSAIVTNTTSGCATSANLNVVTVSLDNTTPSITLTSALNSGTITCSTTSITVTPTITPSSNLSYTWTSNTGSGIAGATNQAVATFTNAGTYSLAITNTITGCVSIIDASSEYTVSVDANTPNVSIAATSSNSIIGCGVGSSTVTLGSTIVTTNSPIITWLPNNASTPTLAVTSAGIYTLMVVDAVNSCSATAQYTVIGNTNPPQNVNAGTSVSTACNTSSVTLNGTTTSTNVSYFWSGPTPTCILSGSNTSNAVVNMQGNYTLIVSDNLTGCQSTATVNVIQTIVVASFTANPVTGNAPLATTFSNTSVGAITYGWDFGDSNTSSQQNPNNTFTSGTYTVTLTASSGACVSTTTMIIIANQVVEDSLVIEIPNVFTPNNDNVNDLYEIKTTGVKEVSLQIFNRWGEMLYDKTDSKVAWNGLTQGGMSVPVGTYFYFVKALGYNGKEVQKQGSVSLFR